MTTATLDRPTTLATRIIIVDDHKIVREGLVSLLQKHADIQVVGDAANGRAAVALAAELSPDVVLMDVAMPDLNGIDATRQIMAASPRTHVIALSMHADRRFVAEMLKAGAKGYVLKDAAFDELEMAIRAVMADRKYLSPHVADMVVEGYLNRQPSREGGSPSVFAKLSPREREVLQLMAEGKATKEIAHALFVSVKTIETHRRQIMSKLEVYSVAELTKYAIREGLTTLE